MAYSGIPHNAAASDASLATVDRQLTQLVSGPSAAQELHLTSVVQQLSSSSSSSSSGASLHTLLTTINALLHAQNDVNKGLQLINEVVRVAPWEAYAASCPAWIQAAQTHWRTATIAAVQVLNVLLGAQGRQRAEYWRNVGGEAAKKYALLLVGTAEDEQTTSTVLRCVLDALRVQIEQRPGDFRVYAPRIEGVCMRVLFKQKTQSVLATATTLLARLPLTGNGQERQEELWAKTFGLLLGEAQAAWQTCSDTFIQYEPAANGQAPATSVFTSSQKGDTDSIEEVREAHGRLALLLGSAPQAGILALFLGEATPFVVALRWGALFNLLHSILGLLPSSPSQLINVPEAALHATQAALLPQAHLSAISMLVALPHEVWHAQHSLTIMRLTRIALKGSPSIRCAALQALAVLRLPMDPHGDALERVVRTCLAQLSRLVNQEVPALASAAANGAGDGRSNKKRKVAYESDQVIMRPLRGFVELGDDDEYAACIAAAQVLAHSYGYLTTYVKMQLHDLAQSGGLLVLALVEIALKQPDELSAQLVRTLARMLSASRGPLLGLLTARSAALCAQAMISSDDETRAAAEMLQVTLSDTFNPKLPPKLSLRLHVEEHDRLDVEAQDELQLETVVLDEDRGTSERLAMQDVLDIGGGSAAQAAVTSAATTTTTTPFGRSLPQHTTATNVAAFASPTIPASSSIVSTSTHAAAGSFSPDPVKPIRRPSTPRIGSPGVAANGLAATSTYDGTLGTGVAGAAARSTSASSQTSSPSPVAAVASRPLPRPSSPLAKVGKDAAGARLMQTFDDDDDDDSMPEIDMRSSDEESGAGE